MHEALRHRALGGWSNLVCRHPAAVLVVALSLAAAAVGYCVLGLSFKPNRNDLISKKLDWNQRFIAWQSHFPGANDLYVVVDAYGSDGEPDAATAAAARDLVDELGPQLAGDPHVREAVWGFPAQRLDPRLIQLLPLEAFQRRVAMMGQAGPMLASPTLPGMLREGLLRTQRDHSQLQRDPQAAAAAADQFVGLLRGIAQVLQTPVEQPVSFAQAIGVPELARAWTYLESDNGRLLFIRVTPRGRGEAINAYAGAIDAIRARIRRADAQHPDIPVGLTGIEVIENDETAVASRDSTIASIVAVALIAVLLVAAFHSWRVPLLIIVSLLVGVAWSFGFVTLAIGYLQVISVIFTVMLLGLGVAFGIHIATRFELVRHEHPDTPEGFCAAMRDTFQTIGPGVITGAVTTAAAFCTTLFTDFTGVAEMGLIAGVGVLLCLLAMFSVFPALMRLVKPSHRHMKMMDDRFFHLFDERWIGPFARYRRITLTTTFLLCIASAWAVSRMHFDFDLMKLLPEGVDSVQWQQRIVRDGGQSVYFGISTVASVDEARDLAQRYRAAAANPASTIAGVGGFAMVFPEHLDDKLALIRQTRAAIADDLAAALRDAPARASEAPNAAAAAAALPGPPLPGAGAGMGMGEPDLAAILGGMQWMLAAADTAAAPPAIKLIAQRVTPALSDVLAVLNELAPGERQARLDRLQREYAQLRASAARQMDAALNLTPVAPADLPPELLRSHVATVQGVTRYAVEVYPRLPQGATSPLTPGFLPRFVGELERIDPHITGVVVQVYRSGDLIRIAYLYAGGLALVVVFILVWIDFQRIDDAVLALVPVAIGFLLTFALMWLIGMWINPANIIVLPLMFGIGVDAGVHMLHRYRQDPDSRPLGLSQGTGKGITITTLTTMVGFGTMILAHHRGIASLGFVLTAGMGLTLLACCTTLPAWLEVRRRREVAENNAG
jgi:predicted RND superfamily exporter protein